MKTEKTQTAAQNLDDTIEQFKGIKVALQEKFLALKEWENDLYVLTWRDSNLCVKMVDDNTPSAIGVMFAQTWRDEPTLDVRNGFNEKAVVTRLWNVYTREIKKVNQIISNFEGDRRTFVR